MIFRNLYAIPAFTAGDHTLIREWLHPKNDAIDLPYSIAFAVLEPGNASLPHVLEDRTEVYLILQGSGVAYVGGQKQPVQANDLLLIPAGAEQYVENTGAEQLQFICIVSPPWASDAEVVY